jgi:hypothetical protein
MDGMTDGMMAGNKPTAFKSGVVGTVIIVEGLRTYIHNIRSTLRGKKSFCTHYYSIRHGGTTFILVPPGTSTTPASLIHHTDNLQLPVQLFIKY